MEFKVNIATGLGRIMTYLQLERAEVAFRVFTNGSSLQSNLASSFNMTDEAINNMTIWEDIEVPINETSNMKLNKSAFQARLSEFRGQINYEEDTALGVMSWYMSVNNGVLEKISAQIKETDKSGIWR
jgi:hypothetical protein